MVKRNIDTALSEEEGAGQVLNENGKRENNEQNSDGQKRVKTKSWFRQPTVQELNRLQETENLFNSNLFRLQIDEVLEEVKLKEKTEKKFTEWFDELKTHLLNISEDDKEYDLSENTLYKKLKVKPPICKELNKTKCMFKFKKFESVDIVGSYSLGCVINSKLKVDLQITAPADVFTKNDSVNYKYHKKRAAYLAYIASHLNKLETVEDLKYTWMNNCRTKPVLDFRPSGKLGSKLIVRINVICEPEAYKLHRFAPSRNNLRESWLLSTEDDNTVDTPQQQQNPTPYYNSSVLSDLTTLTNQELMNEVLVKSDNLKQAVVLLKIWLRQRNLHVSGYLVALLVVYFVQIKRVNNIMSSYQIVRNIWVAMKSLDLTTQGISLHKGNDSPSIEEFHTHFPVVFLDRTGYYNLFWQMCKGTYEAFKRECSLAVDLLDNGKINSFLPLFMTPFNPMLQFDHILKFKNTTSVQQAVLSTLSIKPKVNYGVDTFALTVDSLHTLLAKGLGKRADLILPLSRKYFSWPVNKAPEKVLDDGYEEKLDIGFILNADHAMKIVEKGPPANQPEAQKFRELWGEKSDLRRFQDGSITEAVVWDGDTAAERRSITRQIINYLFQLKYGIESNELFHVGNQLDCLLARKQFSADTLLYVEESSLEALHAFDALRRDLRQLTDLPLDISAVYGVSSVFSYSSPLPPLRCPRSSKHRGNAAPCDDVSKDVENYTPACHAVMELGHSGKWPGEIEAFRCLKAAFHLQIATRLREQYSLATQAYPNYIDVLKNGLVFRLSIAHPKEITILRKEIENGVAKYRDTEESVKLQLDTVVVPRLRGALHGLHQKHPSFGPTVCLFKRWLSSHLLSPPLFPSLSAELLVAHVYLTAGHLTVPTHPTGGLLRVLNMLVNTDWSTEVIVLDFNGDMTREDISSLSHACSSLLPRPALCLSSSLDDIPCAVSRTGPTRAALARAVLLAVTTLDYMWSEISNMNDNLLGAFIPSYKGYDVLISLSPSLVPHWSERLDRSPSLLPLPTEVEQDCIPVVEFNPVARYLDELRSAYSDFALFFYDRYGGNIIAVLWKPDINEYKDFQILNAKALKPVKVNGELKYKVNTAALIEDFRILGAGLVKDVSLVL